MKKIVLSIFCYLSCIIGVARTIDTIPEPEFMNEVYYHDKINAKLIPLEKMSVEMKSKMKLIGGGSSVYSMDGARSATRIQGEAASFLISISSGSAMDPSMTISLYRFESKKGRREAMLNLYGAMGSGKQGGSAVEVKFKKVKEGTFEIVVTGTLEKGEYGFVNAYSMKPGAGMTTYAFGVD